MNAVLIVVIPSVAFGFGLVVFGWLGQTRIVVEQLRISRLPERQKVVLWKRFDGYSAEDVRAFLGALGEDGVRALVRTLRWDLAFPVVYGAGVFVSAGLAQSGGSSTAAVLALLASGLLMMAADWVENISLLRVIDGQFGLVPVASIATRVKLAGVGLVGVAVLVNAAMVWAG